MVYLKADLHVTQMQEYWAKRSLYDFQ
jgi:hypothetical protein